MMPHQFFHLPTPDLIDDIPPWAIQLPFIRSGEEILDRADRLLPTWNCFAYGFAYGQCDIKPDFPPVVGEWQACSRTMAKAIGEVAPDCVEFLPFRTRNSIGEDQTDIYSIMHYLVWCDAVDRKRSLLAEGETRFRRSRETGGDYLLDRVVLARKNLIAPVCRVKGWSAFYLYRDDVVDALLKVGISGPRFQEVELS